MWFFLTSAFANPSFNGTWKLDYEASDSVEPILEAQGLSWVERKIAVSGRPQQTITWTPSKATVHIQSGWYQRTDVLLLDGQPYDVTYARIGRVVLTSSMHDKGLYTRADLTLRKGQAGVLTTQRTLEDDNTLVLTMQLTESGQNPLVARRIFRRHEP